MSLQLRQFYEFGPFRLDTSERVLIREGETVPLTPKAFETLVVLIENSGRVLEKEELMKRVWPDTYVEEANLAVNISLLRKTLGEKPGGGQYIETVPRRGYRFVAPVKQSWEDYSDLIVRERTLSRIVIEKEVAEGDAPLTAAGQGAMSGRPALDEQPAQSLAAKALPAPRKTPHRTALVIALAAIIGTVTFFFIFKRWIETPSSGQPRRLAILPFRNLKQDAETDFLGFSLADAVITKLGYVSALVVRPSSYVDKYRNREIDPKRVADELNVDTLLTGTFLKEGDRLRITAQLIDVRDDVILWNQPPKDWNYDRLLIIHDEVSQQIIQGLQLKLTSAEAEALDRGAPANPQAYELFLRGVDHYQTNRFASALKMLEQSVEIDPGFALAWAHLGRAYSANAAFQFGGKLDYKKAQDCYERALALNAGQIEAHIFMANLFTDTGRASEAVPLLREVLQTNQNLAEAHWELGYAYRFAGMLKESIEEGERARALDPEVKIYSSAFNSYLYAGEYEKFMRSLPARDVGFVVFYRGLANYYMKNWAQAATEFDRAYELIPDLYTGIGKALSHHIAGESGKAMELLRATNQMIEERGVSDAEGIYKVAQAYAVVGDKASALRVLRRSIEGGFFCYPYFMNDPLLDNIRGETEYGHLMEMARARHEEFKKKFF